MWKEYTEIQQKELEELSVRYKECLDIGKTERELKIRIKEYFADRHKANRVNRPLY